jgi:hypothetical protein
MFMSLRYALLPDLAVRPQVQIRIDTCIATRTAMCWWSGRALRALPLPLLRRRVVHA